jgi:hypothetical protein
MEADVKQIPEVLEQVRAMRAAGAKPDNKKDEPPPQQLKLF